MTSQEMARMELSETVKKLNLIDKKFKVIANLVRDLSAMSGAISELLIEKGILTNDELFQKFDSVHKKL